MCLVIICCLLPNLFLRIHTTSLWLSAVRVRPELVSATEFSRSNRRYLNLSISDSPVLLSIADLNESQNVVHVVMSPLKGRIASLGSLTLSCGRRVMSGLACGLWTDSKSG